MTEILYFLGGGQTFFLPIFVGTTNVFRYGGREGLPRFSRFQWYCQPKFKRIIKKEEACQPFMPSAVQLADDPKYTM